MMLLSNIFIIGISGIIAQIIILRELLINFSGNELTIGIIFANWVIAEALGVLLIGKISDRVQDKLKLFIILNIAFALILPAFIYLARVFKVILGIPFIEAVSLPVIFLSSFILILPLAFLHGGLFSCGCKVYALITNKPESSLGKVYTWETLGTIIGGIILALVFIPLLNSFQTVFVSSFVNILFVALLIPRRKINFLIISGLVLLSLLFFRPLANHLQKSSIQKQWQNQEVLDYRNSNYGNIAITRNLKQYTLFYNGLPVITTPFPDRQFVEEFGNLPLLFHHGAQKVLIAGSGIGGLIAEALRHPIQNLDYVEIDPLIITMLKKYPTALTEREFQDKRVSIINTDPRLFLKTKNNAYDVVIIGLSNQSDLSCNRLFTEEFFALTKKRLNPEGLIALWLPGSLTYLGQELRDLNSCILNSLKQVYKHVRVIPGDYNIFLASDANGIQQLDAALVSRRLAEANISPGILVLGYLEYRLDKKWSDWFNLQLASASGGLNQDLRPRAIFETIKIYNKKISPQFNRIFGLLNYFNLKLLLLGIFLVTLVLIFIFKPRHSLKLPIACSIFTTGFFGMLASLLLIFAYQVFYGYLYKNISILTAVFMAGVATGSIWMTARLDKIKNEKSALIILETLIAVFSFILGIVIVVFSQAWKSSVLGLYLLIFIPGLLMGLEFPLAGKMYLKGQNVNIGKASGVIYACDLMGGWLAGIFAGVVFLPVLGFLNTCILIFALKLSSLILLL